MSVRSTTYRPDQLQDFLDDTKVLGVTLGTVIPDHSSVLNGDIPDYVSVLNGDGLVTGEWSATYGGHLAWPARLLD